MFPPELAIHICSFLDPWNDKGSLLNCALVDSTWLSAAQPVIFRDLTLSFTSPRHEDHEYLSAQSICAHENLLEALDTRPHLVSYIQRLRLKNLETEGLRGGKLTTPWVNENESVARVLKRLDNVRSLTLFRVGYNTVLPLLQEAIRNLIQRNPIISLDISYATFPSFSEFIGIISTPTSLTRVSLSSLKFIDKGFSETHFSNADGSDVTLATPRSRSIKDLQLSLIQIAPFIPCFASPHCPFDFSGLVALRLYELRDVDCQLTTELVRTIGNGLKCLEIEGSKAIPGNYDGLFGLIPGLKTVILGVEQTTTYNPVPQIKSLLASPASLPSSIESIAFRLNPLELRAAFLPNFGDWNSVDLLLSDSSRFPALTTVAIEFPKDSALMVDLIERQFPLLIGDGRLKVQKSLEGTWPKIKTWR